MNWFIGVIIYAFILAFVLIFNYGAHYGDVPKE